jgi:hypothetical protein
MFFTPDVLYAGTLLVHRPRVRLVALLQLDWISDSSPRAARFVPLQIYSVLAFSFLCLNLFC